MRCAIYFVPPADDPLTVAASRWLGRNAYTGMRIEGIETPGLLESDRAFLTAAARRYGFHGTLKAPFTLAPGHTVSALQAALDRFAETCEPFELTRMRIALLGDFYALVPAAESDRLHELAASVVREFDGFRAPLTDADLARRGRAHLTARQNSHLLHWGYPFVFEEFRFHMTLTGPVPVEEQEHVSMVLAGYFGSLLDAPLCISQLALFTEPEPYAPLRVYSAHPFSSHTQRKTA